MSTVNALLIHKKKTRIIVSITAYFIKYFSKSFNAVITTEKNGK